LVVGYKQKKAATAAFLICRTLSGASALAIFLAETLDSARRVHNLLLTGPEGMAGRTDFNVQGLGAGRFGLELAAAAAGHVDFDVIGVNAFFHGDVLVCQRPVNLASQESARLFRKFGCKSSNIKRG
jgi:hypothetical protein